MKDGKEKVTFTILVRWIRRLILIAGGILVTLAYFLVLPLLQSIGTPPEEQLQVRSVGVTEAPPPPPPQQKEEEEEEEEKKPELKQQRQPLDLSQLELALNPGSGGGMGGEFAIDLGRHVNNAGGMDDVFSMLELDQKPRAIYQPSPRYPRTMQSRGVSGTVYVVFIVGTQGRVHEAKVQKSTHSTFERPALEAVRRWKFEPGKRNGKPVEFRMRVPIKFSQG